jgi:hypothetical protein
MAFPFWCTPLLRLDHPVEVCAYVVVTVAIALALELTSWVARLDPIVRVVAGGTAIAVAIVIYTIHPPLTGAAGELLAFAWGLAALAAYWVIKNALAVKERLSLATRYAIASALIAVAVVVYVAATPWLDRHPGMTAVVLATGLAGVALVPGRFTHS